MVPINCTAGTTRNTPQSPGQQEKPAKTGNSLASICSAQDVDHAFQSALVLLKQRSVALGVCESHSSELRQLVIKFRLRPLLGSRGHRLRWRGRILHSHVHVHTSLRQRIHHSHKPTLVLLQQLSISNPIRESHAPQLPKLNPPLLRKSSSLLRWDPRPAQQIEHLDQVLAPQSLHLWVACQSLLRRRLRGQQLVHLRCSFAISTCPLAGDRSIIQRCPL
mmetsp:Transcript_25285/g.55629  ORF Transcript_25285/g.55629 Transcript_25285/m.55629 type:complete len:220 (+) Transcript_25285:113-772(+)